MIESKKKIMQFKQAGLWFPDLGDQVGAQVREGDRGRGIIVIIIMRHIKT